MTESLPFPTPEASDPEDVAWNLQTGGTMWARGDNHEAVRWLRRAAEAASDAGSDQRAVTLARAAADLTAALQLPPSIIPPPSTAPSTETTPAPVPVSARPMPPPVTPLSADEATTPRPMPVSRPKAPPLSPPDEATVHDYSIARDVEARERQRPPPSRRPPPPSRSSPSASPPPSRSSPSASPPPLRSSPSASPPPLRSSPAAAVAPTRSSPSAAPPPQVPPSSSPHTSRSSANASPGPSFRPRQALRVAVTVSPDDKGSMLVRALADDEPLPAGAHEALLVALEAGVHLTSKKR